jgi:hypothetical protein
LRLHIFYFAGKKGVDYVEELTLTLLDVLEELKKMNEKLDYLTNNGNCNLEDLDTTLSKIYVDMPSCF